MKWKEILNEGNVDEGKRKRIEWKNKEKNLLIVLDGVRGYWGIFLYKINKLDKKVIKSHKTHYRSSAMAYIKGLKRRIKEGKVDLNERER